MILHIVMAGESLASISEQYNMSPYQIAEDNGIPLEDRLAVGQCIIVNPEPEEKLGSIKVNGYALPNIDNMLMVNTLPDLTCFSMFSYRVLSNGEIASIVGAKFDNPAISMHTLPVMVLTNIGPCGDYSGELAHIILANDSLQQKVVNSLLKIMKEKKFEGINVDFEYIYAKDKTLYNQFISLVKNMCAENGYLLKISLAPKTSATSVLETYYEGHDYKFLGDICDYACIMTYQWGTAFTPARPAAPIGQVEQVVQYAVSEISPNKIFLGIPNFGYDWNLPYTAESTARTIGILDAVEIAKAFNAEIMYDEEHQAPYVQYCDYGRLDHIVWFEDPRSIKAKIQLVKSYNLGGISIWTIGMECPQSWYMIKSLYDIDK